MSFLVSFEAEPIEELPLALLDYLRKHFPERSIHVVLGTPLRVIQSEPTILEVSISQVSIGNFSAISDVQLVTSTAVEVIEMLLLKHNVEKPRVITGEFKMEMARRCGREFDLHNAVISKVTDKTKGDS